MEWEIKPITENNIGGARYTALEKASGLVTRQKTTGSGPATNQTSEEALSHQSRETEKIR